MEEEKPSSHGDIRYWTERNRDTSISQCVTHLCRVPRSKTARGGRVSRDTNTWNIVAEFSTKRGQGFLSETSHRATVHANTRIEGARRKDTVIRRRPGLSRVPLFMNVTRTPYSWFLLLSRESYDPETQWDVGRGRGRASWWTGAKRETEKGDGCGLRVEVREEKRERERESKSKIQSSVVIYDAFSSEQPRLS